MVAHAMEVPVELLPVIPELLRDIEAIGSDPQTIVEVVRGLKLGPDATAVDVGCGKGATAIALASRLGLHVTGVDLFEPFIAHAKAAADRAGVAALCTFVHGDAVALAGALPASDVAVFAALGDVLGNPTETMSVVRRYVRPGGYVVIWDLFLRDADSPALAGYGNYLPRAETVQALTAWGDQLVAEIIEPASTTEDALDSDVLAQRVTELADRYPENRQTLLDFADSQRDAVAHIATHYVDAIWVLQRGPDAPLDASS